MNSAKELQEIEQHLQRAEHELELAVAKLGSLRGFVRGWIGWLSEYKRLVSLLLKLRTIRIRASYAVSRNPIKEKLSD
jgi:hypothetical protein